MEITEEIIEAIGFEKVDDSPDPMHYVMNLSRITGPRHDKMLSKMGAVGVIWTGRWWEFGSCNDDGTVKGHEATCVEQLMSMLLARTVVFGQFSEKDRIGKVLGL